MPRKYCFAVFLALLAVLGSVRGARPLSQDEQTKQSEGESTHESGVFVAIVARQR